MAVPVRPAEVPDDRGAGDPDSTRGRLLRAAVEVFSERGYEGAKVQEIARRAGLTTGAIYGNFRGKAELLFEAIGAGSRVDLDRLLATRAGGSTAAGLLADLGSHLLDRGTRTPGLLIEAFVAARRDPDLAQFVRSILDERASGINHIVDQARAEGDVADEVSTDAVVSFALLLVLGSLVHKALGLPVPDQADFATLMRRVVGSFSDAAATPDTDPAAPTSPEETRP